MVVGKSYNMQMHVLCIRMLAVEVAKLKGNEVIVHNVLIYAWKEELGLLMEYSTIHPRS